ncbi:MAG: hypothetical protein LBT89_03560, partial [Planctomycetaceae bacterium]|nr:hypothetical protein [Planctomycetaceae bacterium]
MKTFAKVFWLTVLGLSAAATMTLADDGLVNQWTFDGNLNNAVNRQFNAAGSVKFVDGVHGQAADLSGNCVIEIPAGIIPANLKELTFSAWVMPKNLNGYIEIFRKEDVSKVNGNPNWTSQSQMRLLFAFQENGHFLTLGLNTGGNYAECDAVITPEEILDGQWHHVAGTFDGKTMHVYLDGKEIGSYERQGTLQTANDYRPIALMRDAIARNEYDTVDGATVNAPGFIGSSEGKGEFFNGKLDDFRIYSRALSAGDIQSAFSAGRPILPLIDKTFAASRLYVKGDSFVTTLLETEKKVAQAEKMTPLTVVQLHRFIRNDFPLETNVYVIKNQRSPVEMMTWDKDKLLQRGKSLETGYGEYLPLTENQWTFLTEQDRTKWTRVKNLFASYQQASANLESADRSKLYEAVLDMENVVEERPRKAEGVAGYKKPETPEVKDRTADEARQILEADWLFQCGGKPTVERSLQEIGWARALAARIQKQYSGKVNFDAELQQLGELETKVKSASGEDAALYFAVRKVKREITFKNPVIDFDSILYVDGPGPQGSEANHETRHRLGYMAVPGGRLMTLKGLHPGGHQTKLMPQEPLHGSFWRPDLSYDGKRVLVGFKPHNEKNFHIYEVGVDGSMERQLTAGIFDDFDPIYLPDGKNIMFLTSRGHIYVRCMPTTNAFVLARMSLDTKAGDKSLYIISRNGEPEYTPSVMNDGRVIYTRWEYTDKPLWRAQSLWTMNSDGTQVQTFWGNQSVWPDLLKDARSIPGSERVMFTGAGHHNWFGGSIGIIDPGKGFNFPDGLTKVTQELPWVEVGNGPVDPKESVTYHTAGNYKSYYSPYPLSEKDFMVSADKGKRVLLLMDTDGNRELILEGVHHIWDAQPIRSRNVPQVAADRVNWPDWESRDKPATGRIYSNNVYENAPEELRGKAKYLRIWSIEHKTYTLWYNRNYVSSGPEISVNQSEGVKKIIGTVPVEEDGSVSFTAPSGIALHFQLL